MDKIACGPGFPEGVLDLDKSAADNARALAAARASALPSCRSASSTGRAMPTSSTSCARSGARVCRLITDGDVAGVMNTSIQFSGWTCTSARAARRKTFSPARRSIRRRPVPGPAGVPQRRRKGARPEARDQGPREEVRSARAGPRRRHLCRPPASPTKPCWMSPEISGEARYPPGDELADPHGAGNKDETPALMAWILRRLTTSSASPAR